MGAWEKLALGWLGDDLAAATLGDDRRFDLGPAEGATARPLPGAARQPAGATKTHVAAFPVDGTDPNYFYSGKGDDIDTP